jgi:hypothetical protein
MKRGGFALTASIFIIILHKIYGWKLGGDSFHAVCAHVYPFGKLFFVRFPMRIVIFGQRYPQKIYLFAECF